MNYSAIKKNKTVKYIVIHYTGMKNLKLAYKKLSDNHSNVSSHYLISKNGKIYNLLCPKFKAWHAGESKWNNHVNINDYSIGIELENKGHEYGYSSFTLNQYVSLKKIIKFLKPEDYEINEESKSILLSSKGMEVTETLLKNENLITKGTLQDLENISIHALKQNKKDLRITILKSAQEAKKEIEKRLKK